MSRILVTGGAGFVGSHLCDRLLQSGADVVVLDNLFTGHQANIRHLVDTERCVFVEHDVRTVLPRVGALKAGFTRIYNLACPASPPHYQRDPVYTMMTSVVGTANLLERAREDGARFFQASTSEVYGDPEVHPQPESYRGSVNTTGPRACYDEGKRAAESLCLDYHRTHGVAVRIARIFNTYGPRMDPNDGRVVSNFIVQALAGEPITMYGDGSQTRSFCYVDDLVSGFVKLMEHESEVLPVNLGNDGEFTMLQLANLVLELTKSKSPIVFRPLPVDDPTQRKPELTRAHTLLGYRQSVALRDGIEKTIEYFRQMKAITK